MGGQPASMATMPMAPWRSADGGVTAATVSPLVIGMVGPPTVMSSGWDDLPALPAAGPLSFGSSASALAEQNDEWIEQHRYMGSEILAACQKVGFKNRHQ